MQFHFFRSSPAATFLIVLVKIMKKDLQPTTQLEGNRLWQVYKLDLTTHNLTYLFRIQNARVHVGQTLMTEDGSKLLLSYKQTFMYRRYPTIDREPYFRNFSGQVVFNLETDGQVVSFLHELPNEPYTPYFNAQLAKLKTHRHLQYVYSCTPEHTRIHHQPHHQAEYQGIKVDLPSRAISINGVNKYEFDEKILKLVAIKEC